MIGGLTTVLRPPSRGFDMDWPTSLGFFEEAPVALCQNGW